jgi:tRNA(Ile2) C34 agmatinyltransferase TiaS
MRTIQVTKIAGQSLGRKRLRKKAWCPQCGQLRTVRVDGQIINHRCGW